MNIDAKGKETVYPKFLGLHWACLFGMSMDHSKDVKKVSMNSNNGLNDSYTGAIQVEYFQTIFV